MTESELNFAAVCTGCGTPQRGRLVIDATMTIVDSDGGMLLGDGWKCHQCLGAVELTIGAAS